ncbi:hypothetical protein ACEWY4_017570 [Coilia grayii]|uniref:ERI1 exoribonuclease 2 n=1 Tax=Coilia grayii TaxID=363190 RepID=A0ABD1JK46_9TELE
MCIVTSVFITARSFSFRQLGIIRKRKQNKEPGQTKRPGSKQYFPYLIIIDFESTCWKEKNNYGQEIIEFPAVLLNTSTGEVESEFHTYVQPQEHPVLSEFCTELTGITQTQVEAGVPLAICLSRFTRWLQTLQQERGVAFVRGGKAPLVAGSPCAFVTWSDWDLGVCLLYECKRKQICKPEALNSWIDLRATYKLFYDRKPKGLNGALQDLGIEFSGREHSGLDDARNTARLAWRMIIDGCFMKITKSLDRAPLKAKSMFPNASIQNASSDQHGQSKTETQDGATRPHTESSLPQSAAKPPSDSLPTHTSLNTHNNQTSDSCQYQSLVTPRTVLSGLSCRHPYDGSLIGSMTRQYAAAGIHPPGPSPSPRTAGLVLVSTTVGSHSDLQPKQLNFDLEASDVDWTDGVLLPETDESGSYDDVVLEEEHDIGSHGNSPQATANRRACWNVPGRITSSCVTPTADSVVVPVTRSKLASANTTPNNNQLQRTSDEACFKKPRPVSAPAGVLQRSILRPFNRKTTSPIGSAIHMSVTPSCSARNSVLCKTTTSSNLCPTSSLQISTTTSISTTSTTLHQTTSGSLASNHSLRSIATPCSSITQHCTTSGSSVSNHSLDSSANFSSSTTKYPYTTPRSSLLQSLVHHSKSFHGHNEQRVSDKTPATSSRTFTVYQDVESQPSTSTGKQTSTGGSFSVPPSVLSSRVNQSQRGGVARVAGKLTSPLCGCGRRAKRLTVGNGGPNHGRAFYCCPVRRSGSGPANANWKKKEGCGFFKWESALLCSVTPGLTRKACRGGGGGVPHLLSGKLLL